MLEDDGRPFNETILVLPPGSRGNITITEKAWLENNYTIEGIGQSVKERAMELGTTMSMEYHPGTFGGVFIKWYPEEEGPDV